MTREAPLVVGGAGLAGMAAAIGFGQGSLVFERDQRPGGLVRTDCIEGFWFDRVLHLLHFRDAAIESWIKSLLGDTALPACPPDAFVETAAGTARYPIQMNLGDLPADVASRCIMGMVESHRGDLQPPLHYGDVLRNSFGQPLCDLFFEPYNRKQWRVPLLTLTADAPTWNLHQPKLDDVIRAALSRQPVAAAYNQRAVYPQPPGEAPWRGMEVVTRALAAVVADLRVCHSIVEFDPNTSQVAVAGPDGNFTCAWTRGLVVTMPLPLIISKCRGVPAALREAAARLPWNGITSLGVRIRGKRPALGGWRYYSDPGIVFTRLVFLHHFDPLLAPPWGWPLLVEVPWRGEDGPPDARELIDRVLRDIRRIGVADNCEVIGVDVWNVKPAYVRFEHDVPQVVADALSYLRAHGVYPVGRYGKWEYSSMQHALAEGFQLGQKLKGVT